MITQKNNQIIRHALYTEYIGQMDYLKSKKIKAVAQRLDDWPHWMGHNMTSQQAWYNRHLAGKVPILTGHCLLISHYFQPYQ